LAWPRKTRLPVLLAWILILGVVAYLSTHPRLVAPFASHLVSRNLLKEIGGNIRVGEYNFRYLRGVDLHNVSATFPGENGGLVIVAIDSLSIDYSLHEILKRTHHLQQVRVYNAEVFVHLAESDSIVGQGSSEMDLDWPRLQIDLLEISNASLAVSGSDGKLVESVPALNWRGEISSGSALQLKCRNSEIEWTSHNSKISGLHGTIIIDNQSIRTPSLGGRVNESPVDVVGERYWDGSLDLRVSGRSVKVNEVEDLIDVSLGFLAAGDIDATFVSHGDSLFFGGTFSGELEGYQMEGLVAQATITPGFVQFSDLTGHVNSAWFSGTAEFDVADPLAVVFSLTGDVADVDLNDGLVPEEDDLPTTDGHGRLTIFHSDSPLVTRVTGVLYDGYIETIPFDTCLVDVISTEDKLVFDQVELRHNHLHAVLTGIADSTQYFEGALSVSTDDLATLPPAWGWPALSGRLYGEGSVQGFEEAMGFSGQLTVHDFEVGPVTAGFGDVSLVAGNILGSPDVRADIVGSGFALRQVPMGNFQLTGSASADQAQVDIFRTVRGDSTLFGTGRAAFTDTIDTFIIDNFWVDLEGNKWSLIENISFTAGDRLFSLPGLRLESESGVLEVTSFTKSDSVLAGVAQLDRCDLGLINPFLSASTTLTGQATADVTIAGSPNAPVISLTASVTDSRFELANIDSLFVAGSYSSDRVNLAKFFIQTNHGSALGSGSIENPEKSIFKFWPGAELDLKINVPQANWTFIDQFQIPALERISGLFSADLQVSGTTDNPEVEGDLVSVPFNIHWLHLDQLSGQLHADTDQLVLSELHGNKDNLEMNARIEVPLQFDLLSEPVSPEDGPFFAQLTIPENSDLTPLSAATNAFVETSGRGQGNVTINGPLDHPLYQGSLKIIDGGFVIRGLEEVYRECSADGVFAGDVLSLSNIRGHEGLHGSFTGEGQVVFNGLLLETFSLDLALDRFLVATIPDLRAIVRADHVRLDGVTVGPDSLLVPRFSGELEVLKARYSGDFSEKPGAVDIRVGTVAPEWLADIQVTGAPRTTWVANNAMELELGGDVSLIRDLDGMYMRGELVIDTGRIPVFNNNFRVVRGTLDFSQGSGLEPLIDLEAETRIRVQTRLANTIVERITVHAAGSIDEPEITFSSDSGFSREGIERMLLGLSPFAAFDQGGQGEQGEQGEQSNQELGQLINSSIGAGLNLLEREIASGYALFDNIDTFEINQIQRSDGTSSLTLDPLIGVGKYLGEDLYVKWAQGWSRDNRDFLVEVQILDHLLLQSEARRRTDENNGQNSYSLDLKYRFEY